MAGLDSVLSSTISSIRVNQEALGVIANNIANAASENFTRREITISTEVVNGQSNGAKVSEIRRAVDDFILQSSYTQRSSVGSASALADGLERLQLSFGQPGAENSLNTFVDDFFQSLTDLANDPEQIFLRSDVLDKGLQLASRVSELATEVEQARLDADSEILTTVGEINNLMDRLHSVNLGIDAADKLAGDKNALLDSRDEILGKLSDLMDVGINFSDKGEAHLLFSKGELLNESQRYHLTYVPAVSIDTFVTEAPLQPIEVALLDNNGNPSNNRVTLVSSSDAVPQEVNLSGGKLQGLLELRDSELPDILAQLDEFAQTLAETFNAIHNNGSGFPPPAVLTGSEEVFSADDHNFSGQVQIAILQADGTPPQNPYDPTLGYPPLTLNFDELDGGSGFGTATIQTIIDEINVYFGPPPALKASLGPIDDIRLAAVSDAISTTQSTGTMQLQGLPTGGDFALGAFDFSGGVIAPGDTMTIGGQVFNFIANGTASNGNNIEVGADNDATVTEIARYLNSTEGQALHVDVARFSYQATGTTLDLTAQATGLADNGIVLSAVIAADGANGNPTTPTAGGLEGDTITIDGTVFTFIANGTASFGNFIEVQGGINATVSEIATRLNLSTDTNTLAATYVDNGDTLEVTHDLEGVGGDAFTLAADFSLSGSNVSINGGLAGTTPNDTLQGGGFATGNFEFDLELTNISGDDVTVEVLGVVVDNGAAGQVGVFDPFTATSGVRQRTDKPNVTNDSIVVDLTGSTLGVAQTHTISVQIQVTDSLGNVSTDTIDYDVTIPAFGTDIKNDRFAATASGIPATLTTPTNPQRFATARLVDENGAAVGAGESGFLQIQTNQVDFGIVFDEQTSQENGLITSSNSATNRGISHFFGLNNFFETGGTLKNSAFNMTVREEISSSPARIATGALAISNQPTDPTANPIFTYEIGQGSNQNATRLFELNLGRVSFDGAGSQPPRTLNISGYSAEIISFTAQRSNTLDEQEGQQILLLEAFQDRLDAIGGVNIDEELANTLAFQNNFSASARLINVVNDLFDRLLEAF